MKKYWYLIYIVFCFYLLLSIPGTADSAASKETRPNLQDTTSTRSIIIPPKLQQFTLIFKKTANIRDLYLTAPDEKKYSLAKEDNGILATANYGVVQMHTPTAGKWVLSGPEEQLQEVLILVNANLGTNFTSGTYFIGELITLNSYLKQDEQPIKSDLAAKDLKMNFELHNSEHNFSYVIPYDKNGVFTNAFILDIPVGTYQATLRTEGTYINQKKEYQAVIHPSPFEQMINAKHDSVMIQLQYPNLIKPESVHIKLIYKDKPTKTLFKKSKDGWTADLYYLCERRAFSEEYVIIQINAQMVSGRPVLFKLLLNGAVCTPGYKPPAETVDAKKLLEEEIKRKRHAKHVLIFVISIIILLIAVTGLAFWLWSKRKKKKSDDINIIG
ncbi:hypothetical protein [Legionella saoudiensis]|uniref:hypothetical protein n=1 Tax=Legionella saoudiensis TaxID=1750561 RepID=UPI000730A31E|nr:hypothetical protein [Legionella saoudiensis]